jgi:cytochrome c peroxidase
MTCKNHAFVFKQMTFFVSLIISSSVISLASANSEGANLEAEARKFAKAYVRPKDVPHPKSNPHTPAKEALGRSLFFDPRLSESGFISCATCHNPALGWEDGLAKGFGHGMKPLGRHTPTVLNLAWASTLFWDGRAETLEEQALGPITAAAEMNMPKEKLVAKLKEIRGYEPLFKAAFPGEEWNETHVAKALATYQRTLVSGNSRFDAWVNGRSDALNESEKRGFLIYNTKAACSSCHSGWRFTDDSFHDIGVLGTDKGRGEILPEVEVLQFAFKTPTLRNVTQRSPFMHDGSEKTLEDVVAFYDRGGNVKTRAISDQIKPLGLTDQEKSDLVNFMKTLTGKDKSVRVPMLPIP